MLARVFFFFGVNQTKTSIFSATSNTDEQTGSWKDGGMEGCTKQQSDTLSQELHCRADMLIAVYYLIFEGLQHNKVFQQQMV